MCKYIIQRGSHAGSQCKSPACEDDYDGYCRIHRPVGAQITPITDPIGYYIHNGQMCIVYQGIKYHPQ